MSTQSKETIDVNGCRVSMMRAGTGPTVLVLQNADWPSQWLPFMDRLSEHYDVVVPDHPGFDASETPDWLDDLTDLAFFYLDFLKALGLRDVHLIGSSLGGWIAAEVAVRSTSRLVSLTLIDAAGIHLKGTEKGDIFLWTPEERIRNMFSDQSLAEARLAVPETEAFTDTMLKNEFATAKLAWEPRFYDPQLRKWMHRIDVPALVVWGGADKIFPSAYAAEYASLLPDARVEILDGCGHLPHVERPDAFLEKFNAFVAEIEK